MNRKAIDAANANIRKRKSGNIFVYWSPKVTRERMSKLPKTWEYNGMTYVKWRGRWRELGLTDLIDDVRVFSTERLWPRPAKDIMLGARVTQRAIFIIRAYTDG